MNIERPAQPYYGEAAWYRGWEAGQDERAMRYTDESWIAYKGGCDLDAPQIAAKSWTELLDEIDEVEEEATMSEAHYYGKLRDNILKWDLRASKNWRILEFPNDPENFFVQADRLSETHPYDIEVLGDDKHPELYPNSVARSDAELLVLLRNSLPAILSALSLAADAGQNIEKLQDRCDGLLNELDNLVKAVAARKLGHHDVPSLYEYARLNFPTAWQLSGGNQALQESDQPTLWLKEALDNDRINGGYASPGAGRDE